MSENIVYDFKHKFDIVNENRLSHYISLIVNNSCIGYINFYEFKNVDKYFFMPDEGDNKDIPHILYLQKLYVDPTHRQKGMSYKLYKFFNEIYETNYCGVPIYRTFANPIAEYTFKKCIALGFVNPLAYTEEFTEREYTKDDKIQLNQLLSKI